MRFLLKYLFYKDNFDIVPVTDTSALQKGILNMIEITESERGN